MGNLVPLPFSHSVDASLFPSSDLISTSLTTIDLRGTPALHPNLMATSLDFAEDPRQSIVERNVAHFHRRWLHACMHVYAVSCGSPNHQIHKALLSLPYIIGIAHRPTLLVTIVLVDPNGVFHGEEIDPSYEPRPTLRKKARTSAIICFSSQSKLRSTELILTGHVLIRTPLSVLVRLARVTRTCSTVSPALFFPKPPILQG